METTDSRVSVFCSEQLAARIERAEAQFMARCVKSAGGLDGVPGFAFAVADGFATYSGPGSPFNKVAGLGFGPLPTVAELAAVEAAYFAENAPVQLELSILGDPELGATLTERGYRLVGFENVLGRDLRESHGPSVNAAIQVRRAEGLEREWMNVVIDAVEHPDTEGVPAHEEFSRGTLERAIEAMVRAGARQYVALLDQMVVGGASLRIEGGLAQMTGAATAPGHRRLGVHAALVAARLSDAADEGCDFAVVTTQPGSRSHANTQRMGFDLLYSRAILVRG